MIVNWAPVYWLFRPNAMLWLSNQINYKLKHGVLSYPFTKYVTYNNIFLLNQTMVTVNRLVLSRNEWKYDQKIQLDKNILILKTIIPLGISNSAADLTFNLCFVQRSVRAFINSSTSDCIRSALTCSMPSALPPCSILTSACCNSVFLSYSNKNIESNTFPHS